MNRTRFFSVFLCLIAVVVTLAIIVLNGSEYETLFLLPLTYAASVFFVSLDSKRRNSFTYWAVVIVSFIRYVVCPFFEVIAGSLDDPSRLFSSNDRVREELFQTKPKRQAVNLLNHIIETMTVESHKAEIQNIIDEVKAI